LSSCNLIHSLRFFDTMRANMRQMLASPQAGSKPKKKVREQAIGNVNKAQMKERFAVIFEKHAGDYEALNYTETVACLNEAGTEIAGFEVTENDFDQNRFERFDFDGDGSIKANEARVAFAALIRKYAWESGQILPADVPQQTPEQAGYTVKKILASGGQGSTALAQNAKGKDVALKIYDKSNANAGGIDALRSEWETMQRLQNNSACMRCTTIFQDAEHFYCVNELLPGGDLASLRKNCDEEGVVMDEDYFIGVFAQCISGLAYMHKKAIMHCDIKEPNIMLKSKDYEKPQVCLIDFGMATILAGTGQAGGTAGYVPPETVGLMVGEQTCWYPRGDVFSMGVVFYQLVNDQIPDEKGERGLFGRGATSMEQIVHFTKTRKPDYTDTEENFPNIYEFLPDMLEKDRTRRPTSMTLEMDIPKAGLCGACSVQ